MVSLESTKSRDRTILYFFSSRWKVDSSIRRTGTLITLAAGVVGYNIDARSFSLGLKANL